MNRTLDLKELNTNKNFFVKDPNENILEIKTLTANAD